mmetsp:Transcript_25452/g.70982  ORF Transcript_25452/g.70982 Transcript_25452/m.70982 type:complete len:226 (+) Transcript_25452:469-1146(+)
MHAYDLFAWLRMIANYFHVASHANFGSLAVQVPLQRHGRAVVNLDVFLAELSLRIVLGITDGAIFDGREDGRGDVGIIHQLLASSEKPPRETPPSLDGHRRKFWLAFDDVANRVNMRDVCLVSIIANELAVLLEVFKARVLDFEPTSATSAADGQQHGVEYSIFRALDEDPHLSRRNLLEPGRYHLPGELGAVLLHVVADHSRDLLVEAAKENGPDHDGNVKAES